jgi:lipoprotein-anchoring transpeptidase ErfK/SrfK
MMQFVALRSLFKFSNKKILYLFIFCVIQVQINAQPLRENVIFQWVGAVDRVAQLDALIDASNQYALIKSDYNNVLIKKFILNKGVLLNYKDSLSFEVAIQKTATHFFNDLAYGNKPPLLDYRGAKFNMTTFNIPLLIKQYNATGNLETLITFLNQQSIEVKTILDSLHVYQKAKKKNKNKIDLLILAANNYRWLNAVRKQQRIVVVNIPSAQLKVYEEDKIELQMKVILGKPSTPTPSLSSYISQVTINPYWTVPKSIIIREMLPKIKNDLSYLAQNHLEVLSSNYKTIQPSEINWYAIDTLNFPYIIRQATGCENALGILKLEFENPFSVYLHDTPEKQLFNLRTRFLSHGCMRMEKPIEMGRLLLKDKVTEIDTMDLTTCHLNLKPTNILVSTKTPLVVWYNLVDFDSNNKLMFYKNVYNR